MATTEGHQAKECNEFHTQKNRWNYAKIVSAEGQG